MGRGVGSSSKRKSSRKKRSMVSSERKTSRRNKSKKLRRRFDSVSSYSDVDPASLVSVSSYTSEDDNRSKRTRSRRRNAVRSRRKRARSSSSSRENSEHSSPVKKRKISKRSRDHGVSKKSSRKRIRRDASIDTSSSYSRSSSTCNDVNRNSSSEESGHESRRVKPIEKKRDGTALSKVRTKTQHVRYRSPSYSPSSKYNGNSDNNDERVLVNKNNSLRLRSIVIVVKPDEDKEEKVLDNGEEIVYDHDDYPSSKSNDSNDGENKGEMAEHICVASENRGPENVMGERFLVSTVKATPIKTVEMVDSQHGETSGLGDPTVRKNHPLISNTIAGLGDGDLEAVLRQKALANLKKFRGQARNEKIIPSSDKKSKSESDTKQLRSMLVVPDVVESHNRPSLRRDLNEKTVLAKSSCGIESKTTVGNTANPSHGIVVSANIEENNVGGVDQTINKCELVKPAVKKESPPSYTTTMKEAATSQADPLVAQNMLSKNATEKPQTPGQNSNSLHSVGLVKDNKSALAEPSSKSSTSENSSKEPQDEAKDGSQFQQKTMSVMRGGEMVQVSYKVYIPKNAPALARRKLQR